MAYIGKIPNDQRNRQLMMAVESIPGQRPASGWRRMNGSIEFPIGSPALSDYEDATGTYMADASPSRGTRVPSGNFSAPASYESLPIWARMVVEAGGTPASGTGPDYTYIQEPPLTIDDIDTYAALMGVLGNGFQSTGIRLSEVNIATDYENANGFWEVSGTAMASEVDQLEGSFEGVVTAGTPTTLTATGETWTVDKWAGAFVFNEYGWGAGPVRQVVSNTADTLTVSTPFDTAPAAGDIFRIAGQFPAGVATLDEEKIKNAGTKLWVLPESSTPDADNNIRKRIISSNVNMQLNLDPKGFLEDAEGTMSGVYGRGVLRITGQVRMEFDRYDELARMKAMSEMLIQFENQGSDLGGGVRKLARVVVPRAVWNEHTGDTRNNNLTQTLSFRAYQATPPLVLTTRNGLATLG